MPSGFLVSRTSPLNGCPLLHRTATLANRGARQCVSAGRAPGARAVRGQGPGKPITAAWNEQLPCLYRPLLPLAVGLPRMLEQIKAELPIAQSPEKCRLLPRAGMIRELLRPTRHNK